MYIQWLLLIGSWEKLGFDGREAIYAAFLKWA